MDIEEFAAHRATVATPFGEIAYIDIGEGPVALFVHGVFLNSLLWRDVIDNVRHERRCIAVDLLAHGSTKIDPGQDVSMPTQAEMLESVCTALDLGPIDLVGNDSGAAIAQIFAAHHPAWLRTLTLTNTDVHTNLPPEAFAATVEVARQGGIGPFGAEMLRDPALARSEFGLGVGYEHPDQLNEETIRAYLEPLLATPQATLDLERFIASFNADHLVAIEPRLKELQVPTLIVWGTDDVFFDVSWAYWLRDTIPGAREVVEIENAKLFFPEERPLELATHLRRHWSANFETTVA